MSIAGNISDAISDVDLLITQQATELSEMLNDHRLEMFPPDAKKTLRPFQLAEVAQYVGITSGYLKNIALEGKGPLPAVTSSGRRSYTAQQMLELRHFLDKNSRTPGKYVPQRRANDHLQVLAIVNFKGGSGP